MTLKQTQRSGAQVSAAAGAYAEAVHSKAGIDNPFSDVVSPGLPEVTLVSLAAERDSLAHQHKQKHGKDASGGILKAS